jgi:hypothetical protein
MSRIDAYDITGSMKCSILDVQSSSYWIEYTGLELLTHGFGFVSDSRLSSCIDAMRFTWHLQCRHANYRIAGGMSDRPHCVPCLVVIVGKHRVGFMEVFSRNELWLQLAFAQSVPCLA